MKKTLTILILSLPVLAWGQTAKYDSTKSEAVNLYNRSTDLERRYFNGYHIATDTTLTRMYGKQPKNDTVNYAIEILFAYQNVSSEWHRVLAVRHYEFLPYPCMDYCEKSQPIIDYYIFPISKNKVTGVKILRAVEL